MDIHLDFQTTTKLKRFLFGENMALTSRVSTENFPEGGGGGQRKRRPKNSKKIPKNSTIK